MSAGPPLPAQTPLRGARRWAITVSMMLVVVMQILDTSVTNVALPHMQGSLSAGVEEVAWVLTSYLAANAVVIPATGWLAGLLGRKRFFLICTTVFTASSFLSGAAPNLTLLILADMAHAPSVSVSYGTCRHWKQARMDDRGCCENKEISTRANFTTMKGVSFGCSLWEESRRTWTRTL